MGTRPLAAPRCLQGGEVHGVENRALHPLERASYCPGNSLFGHGAGRPGVVRDGGCSFSRSRPGQGADEVEVKPLAKADPTDGVADQLNAKWLQENSHFSGFKKAEPAVVPASYATPAVANDWGDRLVSRAMKYLGTPYRYGGTSPSTGFDCSGFVYYLYGATFGRSTAHALRHGARGMPVARSDLKRGDLVFFGHRGTFTHVGIYAGNDRFVHATQRGSPVQVTPLDSDYFRDRYMTAVRLSPR